MKKLSTQYINLIKKILEEGNEEFNKRTKTKIKYLTHKLIQINYRKGVSVINMRKFYPHVAAAELAWMIEGTKKTSFIKKYSKMWDKFEDIPGEVSTSYGYRWRKAFGRDQLKEAINALQKDKTNRQVWVTAWDAKEDGLTNIGKTKNVPCPLGFFLNINNNSLDMSVIIRSSDVIVGLPYDIMAYTFLAQSIANTLQINYGNISFYLNHAHIYEPHWELAQKIIKENIKKEYYIRNYYTLAEIECSKINFVEYIKEINKIKIKQNKAKANIEYPEVIL